MDTAVRLEPIPHPPGHLFVGNLFDLDASHPLESLTELARKYGPIYGSSCQAVAHASSCRGMNWSTSCATRPVRQNARAGFEGLS